jgi:selenocysteine-specific elongation factor
MTGGIIGTGGHIDHGKTALVEALTGTRTDRLPEEKRRGITIDLGFAHLELAGGVAGVVDVPGHEDFVRNMVAGASGFDLLLLVVAADEGVMPQTREHVAIAQLLEVPAAVVALTKADLVDPEWLELAADDVAGFLADTRFAGAPIIATSATTGQGLDDLRDTIQAALPGARGRPDDLFRLPVDRVFTVRGTGTVATGTVWSGRLRLDERVRILPGDRTARVRALQVHGHDVDRVAAGQRAAVALAGVDRDEVARGATLVADAAWAATRAVTAELMVLQSTDWSIEHGQRVRVHLGTAEVMARAFFRDGQAALHPGGRGWAELRLEDEVVARAGDPLVLRSYSPVTTIGGGTIAEPAPPRRHRRQRPDTAILECLLRGERQDRVATLVDRAGVAGVVTASLPIATGATPAEMAAALQAMAAVQAGDRAFPEAAADEVARTLVAQTAAYHERHPLRPGIESERLRRAAPDQTHDALLGHVMAALLDDGVLAMRDGRVALPDFQPSLTPGQDALRGRILQAYQDADCAPPRLDELRAALGDPPDLDDVIALLETGGRLTRLEPGVFILKDHLERVGRDVQTRLGGQTDLGPADFRDVIPASRRHLIPILEQLDRTGITTRVGEGRTVTPPDPEDGP